MAIYIRNRHCPCLRCRTRGLMGGAILVTLGVLFLLDEYRVVRFDDSWPVLLIVIGLLVFASRTASADGHIQPRWLAGDPRLRGYDQPDQPGPGAGPSGRGPEVKL